jgi:hypothetical protein
MLVAPQLPALAVLARQRPRRVANCVDFLSPTSHEQSVAAKHHSLSDQPFFCTNLQIPHYTFDHSLLPPPVTMPGFQQNRSLSQEQRGYNDETV